MTRKNKLKISEAVAAVGEMLGDLKQGMQKFLNKEEKPASPPKPTEPELTSRPGWTYRGARRNASRAREWHTFKPEEIVPTSRALVIAWPKRQRLAARSRKTATKH